MAFHKKLVNLSIYCHCNGHVVFSVPYELNYPDQVVHWTWGVTLASLRLMGKLPLMKQELQRLNDYFELSAASIAKVISSEYLGK